MTTELVTIKWIFASFAAVLFFGYIILIFNGIIRLKNDIKKSWANIDVLLKQRSEELPNLINSVKGYMKHEKNVLVELTRARANMLKSTTISQKAAADNVISNALKSIFAVAENYPKLQASENFKQLQDRISGLENELADRREFYNDSVTNYNTRTQSFPDLIITKIMGFKEETLFKATPEDKKHVTADI